MISAISLGVAEIFHCSPIEVYDEHHYDKVAGQNAAIVGIVFDPIDDFMSCSRNEPFCKADRVEGAYPDGRAEEN